MKIEELTEGNYLGVNVLEICSFPSIELFGNNHRENIGKVSGRFSQLLREVYLLMKGKRFTVEFLWLGQRTNNQAFASRTHIYCVLRLIDRSREEIRQSLTNMQTQILNFLASMQFSCEKIEGVDSQKMDLLLKSVEKSCLYAVVKAEKCNANYQSLYPYYYCDIVSGDNYDNFQSLIQSFCQMKECAFSFQVFPTAFEEQELAYINELEAELKNISNGLMSGGSVYKDSAAAEPARVLEYYNLRRQAPLFQYNILAMGSRENCALLAAKIISLLQAGTSTVVNSDFACLDLSSERINIDKQFLYYPYNVNSLLIYKYRNRQLLNSVPMAQNLFRLPYLMTLEEACSFLRLPLYEKDMLSLKSEKMAKTLEMFSEDVVSEKNIRIGKLLSGGQEEVFLGCPEKAFTKHASIVGTPGSGKTTFSIQLLLQFAKRGIPFLAIEPTKTEYRAMIDAIPGLQIFTPGNNEVSPFIINPFIPPKGITVEQYIPGLVSAFQAAFSMPSPLDMFFLKAINQSYSNYGWKSYSRAGDKDVTIFGMHEFILVFKELIAVTNYSREVKGNLESGGLLRLSNLLEQNRNIYDTIHTIPIEELLSRPTVLELNSIENAEQKSLLMALLLIQICIYTKNNQLGDGELKNMILMDEAHVLLDGGGKKEAEAADSQGSTVRAIQSMIAEIRSYGTGIIIADQSPVKVGREIVANTDIKISFRLVQGASKELIADSTNMDENSCQNLSRLRPGEAYLFYSKLDSPQLLKMEDIRKAEGIRLSVSNQEIKERNRYWEDKKQNLRPYLECSLCKNCKEGCSFRLRADAYYLAGKIYDRYRVKLQTAETVMDCCCNMKEILENLIKEYDERERRIVITCTRIQLIRLLQLNQGLRITKKELVLMILKESKLGEE